MQQEGNNSLSDRSLNHSLSDEDSIDDDEEINVEEEAHFNR